MNPFRAEFEDRLTQYFKAVRDFPSIKHGPEPDPEQFNFKTEQDKWEAKQIRARVVKEINRNV